MLKIEKNIPIPVAGNIKPKNEIAQIAQSMKVGDSVFCPDQKTAKKLAYQLGKFSKVVQRQEESGYRIWRQRKERNDVKQ